MTSPSERDDALTPFFDDVRRRVDDRLAAVFDEALAFTAREAAPALPILTHARDLTRRGGKRLRPALLFAAIECVEPGASPEVAADLGAALELLQSYLLIHDDWMDGDAMRRGAPSVHVALGAELHDQRAGDCAAILSGDLTSMLVHDLVARVDLAPSRRRAVHRAFAQMEHEVILGQYLDLTRHDDVAQIHRLKTGSYTVKGPLRLGAAVAGATDVAVAALDAFADPLGQAFQLRDDVLGAFGTAAETGKPVGGDFREGKHTELVAWARARLDPADVAALDGVLGHRDATDDDVARAQSLLRASGALEAAEAKIADLRARCLAALDVDALRPDGRALLAGFAARLTERRR